MSSGREVLVVVLIMFAVVLHSGPLPRVCRLASKKCSKDNTVTFSTDATHHEACRKVHVSTERMVLPDVRTANADKHAHFASNVAHCNNSQSDLVWAI